MRKKKEKEEEKDGSLIIPPIAGLPDVPIVGKFLVSGHSVDQKLMHPYGMAGLLDTLSPQTKSKVKDEVLVYGIKVSPAEDRLMMAIQKMLWYKSTKDKKGKLISAGNMPAHRDMYGGESTDFPALRFTPAELYKEYTGKTDYSGAEALYIKDTITKLEQRRFLIVYKRKYVQRSARGKSEQREQRIEEYMPLLRIVRYYDLTSEEAAKIDKGDRELKEKKGEIVVIMNPLFIDQIDTKFIEYPNNINQRTAIAAGGNRKVTQSINNLRDHLLRAISSNKRKDNAITEVNRDKLPFLLGLDKYVKESRQKLLNDSIQKALETVARMGLVLDVKEVTGAQGQDKLVFVLNLEY
ncbi:MAG: hypothetical protein V4543_14885 [Bacteroidota bacterium]